MGSKCCAKHSLSVNDAFKIDPTRTLTLRRQYEAQMFNRFRKLKGLILREIVDQDGFGLRNNRARFEFERSADKLGAFMRWIKTQESIIILGSAPGTDPAIAAQTSWQNVYIDTAYRRGMNQAASKLRAAGADVSDEWISRSWNQPIHSDRVTLAYTRAYNELEGITDTMDQQISRVLAQGLADGSNPIDIARAINNRVDAIGINRARMLARTEVISAHNEAQLNVYEQAGIQGVDVEAEMLTAVDACPICEDLAAGGPYDIDRARGMIPGETHPNCRCSWSPRVINGSGITLR